VLAKLNKEPTDRDLDLLEPGYDDHAAAVLSAIEREGFKVVPVKPTVEMVAAGQDHVPDATYDRERAQTIYAAMLSAAPKQAV
jgi:hypothetical protein